MATYTVKRKQNIFDIALNTHGSIEGVFDLMITNPNLSMCFDLEIGQEIGYHEDYTINPTITKEFDKIGISPANGERNVYSKLIPADYVVFAIAKPDPDKTLSILEIGGQGTIVIDWGDNSDLQVIELTETAVRIEHYFDCMADNRSIRFYSLPCQDEDCVGNHVQGHLDISLTMLDTSGLGGPIYFTRPITIDSFISKGNDYGIGELFLFDGTYSVNLQDCVINNLMPLLALDNLQELKLDGVKFTSLDVLDDYLEALLTIPADSGQRSGCRIYLPCMPSERGLAAITSILNDPEWNEERQWKIFINGAMIDAFPSLFPTIFI